jgi:predicted phosphoribosyltransferase/SHS2 domain-containing protein
MGAIYELPELRNRTAVFHDRAQAGEVLARMLDSLRGRPAAVLAIPAGGVPVAAVIAERLALPLEAVVVSKITLPWNSEIGYGAVAFDGSVRLNEDLITALALSKRTIEEGIAQTRAKVEERQRCLHPGGRPWTEAIAAREVVLVDDGAATGFTLLTAAEALRRHDPARLIVAVPTGHAETIERLAREVDALYCANVRAGRRFAVADAYQQWHDVSEETARSLLAQHRRRSHEATGASDGSQRDLDAPLPRWEHFPHDADIGVRGIGRTLEEAFEQAALALTAVITDPARVAARQEVDIEVEAPDRELLLVDWLNALIYEMATRTMLFGRYRVRLEGTRLRGAAWGEVVDTARHEPAVEIKGATYTALEVAQNEQGLWVAQCVVDV